ncbi:MAG: hypothetical protein LBU47_07400 [Christensenellaceae bacterium]|nr:hypothetical protein [Christensenellaceae bacterium]
MLLLVIARSEATKQSSKHAQGLLQKRKTLDCFVATRNDGKERRGNRNDEEGRDVRWGGVHHPLRSESGSASSLRGA